MEEAPFLPLLSLLVVGVLLYFPVSPGSYLADTPEISLPLAIVGGLCVFAYLVRFYHDGDGSDSRSAYFGWLGLATGGIASVWLAVHYLPLGFSASQVYVNGLTVVSLSAAVGAVLGSLTSSVRQRTPDPAVDRRTVVAESTWTNRSGSNPILGEVVDQLSEIEEADPLALNPVGSHFNVDIFDGIRIEDGSPWQVLFFTDEYEIRVSSHGTVTVSQIRGNDETGTVSARSAR